ncbi:MAG: hypothetical protein AAGI70_02305 [Pseudomonadota bacterium]
MTKAACNASPAEPVRGVPGAGRDAKSWLGQAASGAALFLTLALGASVATAEEGFAPEYWEFFGEIEFEATGFFEDPQFTGQDRDTLSLAGKATLLAEWLDGDLVFRVTPFARVDSADDRRTHADLREFKLDYVSGDWSFTLGADTLFWGKTEVVHLVDIVNQTDQVEDLDDEDRLGQPLVKIAYLSDLGEISAFALPFFRERPFPGVSGRLRFNPPVNTSQPIFETDAEEWTPSFALRYSGVIGDVDLGLSAFHGLSRDPSFRFDGRSLRPVYSRITQGGIDAQYTTGPTLWKFEGILREGQRDSRGLRDTYVAATGGFEYTFFGLAESNADLGLIGEYAWDQRADRALTTFQNDAIFGARLALNDTKDTAFLLTSAIDLTDAETGLRLEAETRISTNWTLEVEAQGFVNTDRQGSAASFAEDSFVRAKLKWFF